MADLIGDPNGTFVDRVRKLERTDPAEPETWDPIHQALITNDVILKGRVDALDSQVNALDSRVDALEASAPTVPYDLAVYLQGGVPGGSVFFRFVAPRAFTLAQSGHRLSARVAPQNAWTATVKRNGTQVGTISLNAGQTTGTVSFSGAVSLGAGDVLEVQAQATTDPNLQGLTLVLAGVV